MRFIVTMKFKATMQRDVDNYDSRFRNNHISLTIEHGKYCMLSNHYMYFRNNLIKQYWLLRCYCLHKTKCIIHLFNMPNVLNN